MNDRAAFETNALLTADVKDSILSTLQDVALEERMLLGHTDRQYR